MPLLSLSFCCSRVAKLVKLQVIQGNSLSFDQVYHYVSLQTMPRQRKYEIDFAVVTTHDERNVENSVLEQHLAISLITVTPCMYYKIQLLLVPMAAAAT